jgi:hypothetical protein
VKVFEVDKAHRISALFTMRCPRRQGRAGAEIPSGLALSADGRRRRLLNLTDRLGQFDAKPARCRTTWEVGVAPYDVVLVGARTA